jgi:hypothetical protein
MNLILGSTLVLIGLGRLWVDLIDAKNGPAGFAPGQGSGERDRGKIVQRPENQLKD